MSEVRLLFWTAVVLLAAPHIMSDPSTPPTMILDQGATFTREEPRLMGGFTEERPGNDHIQAVADSVKSQVLQQVGENAGDFSEFVVEKYKSQVVAGTNYQMKIRTGGGKYLHVRVFKPLPHEKQPPKVTEVQANKSAHDAL